jgi:hypothetical protein
VIVVDEKLSKGGKPYEFELHAMYRFGPPDGNSGTKGTEKSHRENVEGSEEE